MQKPAFVLGFKLSQHVYRCPNGRVDANFSKACSRATAGWQVAMDLFQEISSACRI